jgi:hypothetical protein
MDRSSYCSSPDKIKVSVPSQGIERSCICVVGVSPLPLSKKCLKGYAEVVIWRRSGNTMIYNTLHNTKDCATRTPLNPGLNSGAPEGSAISNGRRITVNRDEHYTIDDFRWGEYKDWSTHGTWYTRYSPRHPMWISCSLGWSILVFTEIEIY